MPRDAPPVPPSSCAPQLGDGGVRGARYAEPCSPRARPASSSRGVSWEARGPERSHRSGGLLGPAQVLCRLTPAGPRRRGGGPPCERRAYARARAREGTLCSPRTHLHAVPWHNTTRQTAPRNTGERREEESTRHDARPARGRLARSVAR